MSGIPQHFHRMYAAYQRCNDPKNVRYNAYGARGITFDFPSIRKAAQWVADNLGDCPPGMSLDRINNDQGYKPGNLRWANAKQQANNSRHLRRSSRNNGMTAEDFIFWLKFMAITGKAASDAEAGRLLGINPNTVVNYKKHGAGKDTALACSALLKSLQPFKREHVWIDQDANQ